MLSKILRKAPIFWLLNSLFLVLIACTALESADDGEGEPYALPIGLVGLQIFQHSTDENKFAVKITGVSYVPEVGYEYVAKYKPSLLSHDILTVTIAKAPPPAPPIGLIEQVDFTADEKTAEFIIKLVELAKAVKKITAFSPQGEAAIVEDTSSFIERYNGTFDPFSSDSRFHMNVILNRITGGNTPGQGISIHLENSVRKRFVDKFAPRTDCKYSVCFRRPVSIALILKTNGLEFQRVSVVLPDRSKIGGINVTRAAFVKKVTNVKLSHGMIASVTINKPSEALAGVEIPLAIANAILDVPGEILTLRIKNTTQSKQLHDARLSELKAREALVEYQRKQLEAQSSNTAEDNNAPDD